MLLTMYPALHGPCRHRLRSNPPTTYELDGLDETNEMQRGGHSRSWTSTHRVDKWQEHPRRQSGAVRQNIATARTDVTDLSLACVVQSQPISESMETEPVPRLHVDLSREQRGGDEGMNIWVHMHLANKQPFSCRPIGPSRSRR